jgi:N-acetylneuraminic acid mutarotase
MSKQPAVVRVKWNRIEPILMVNKDGQEQPLKDEEMEEGTYSLSVLSPCPRFYQACTIAQSKGSTNISDLRLIVFGGYAQSVLNDCYAYRFDSNQWTKNLTANSDNDSIPSPRYGHSLISYNDKAIAFGGKLNEEQYLCDLFQFDVAARKWDSIPQSNAIKGRAHHSAVLYHDTMYVFGGSDDDLLYDELWAFDLTNNTWTIKERKTEQSLWPSPRDNHTAVVHGNFMYVFGGMDNEGSLDELWRYDFTTGDWEKIAKKGPCRRGGHSAIVHADAMFIYGGIEQTDFSANYLNDMWVFHLTSNKWHTVAWKQKKKKKQEQKDEDLDEELFVDDLEPTARANHSAVILNDTMYVFGGFSATHTGQTLFDDFDTCALPDVNTLFAE